MEPALRNLIRELRAVTGALVEYTESDDLTYSEPAAKLLDQLTDVDNLLLAFALARLLAILQVLCVSGSHAAMPMISAT